MKIAKQSRKLVSETVSVLKKGGVVICPTDTVYGFLADATNKKAVEKIFKIKKRPRSKPLAVFVSSIKKAKSLAEIDERQEKILKKYWPGKYTFILKRKPGVKLYGARKETVAIRIPEYKFLNNLLKKVNRPLAQTSVNISGEAAATELDGIKNKFSKFDILIISAGNLPKNKPSKIVDLTGDNKKVVRY
jgi:L-threonylcarbamoyladenylate synthase